MRDTLRSQHSKWFEVSIAFSIAAIQTLSTEVREHTSLPIIIITFVICKHKSVNRNSDSNRWRECCNLPLWLTLLFLAASAEASAPAKPP